MADLELLQKLKALGVKSVFFDEGEVTSVEFFPQAAPDFGHLDLDTIVPPPPAAGDDDVPNARPVPLALARVMKRGSVS